MKGTKKFLTSFLAIAVLLAAVLLNPMVAYAWGDSDGGRPSYTLEEINSDILGDKVVLNSISDSEMGNEKNFVAVREYNGPNTTGAENIWNANEIIVKDGQDYIIRAYVHNNNLRKENVAEDVHVAFSIPSAAARRLRVNGFIDTSNASPQRYWDYVDFVSDTPFHLEYHYDSALLENNGVGTKGLLLSDEIVTNASGGGVQIGYYDYRTNPSDPVILDGVIPAGYQYSSYITIRVKVVFDTNFDVDTKVRLANSEDSFWKDSVDASVGDVIEFQINYTNTSSNPQTDVSVRNLLPDNLHYINGSTQVVNENHPDGFYIDENYLTTNGIAIGSYGAGTGASITFSAKVVDDELLVGENTLENLGQIMVNSRIMQAPVTVKVQKDEEVPYLAGVCILLCFLAIAVIVTRVLRLSKR